MKLLKQKQPLLFLIIGIIILAIIVYFLVLPLIGKIKAISQEYLANQETLLRLERRGTIIKDLKKLYEDKQPDLSKIEGAFLSSEEVVDFISTLENIAAQTNNIFELQIAKPLTQKDKEELSSLDFRISLWGNFNNLLHFIAYLEDNPFPPFRLISLEGLTIKRLIGQEGANLSSGLKTGDIQSVLDIKVYIQ